MEKILVSFNESNYRNISSKFTIQQKPLQKIVDDFNALKLDYKLKSDDLCAIMKSPRAFFIEILTNEQDSVVGGVKINREKLYDLIDKPQGVEEFTNGILLIKQNNPLYKHEYCFHHEFNIINGVTVVLKPEKIEHLKNISSIYIETQDQKKAYDQLKELASLLNKLKSTKKSGGGFNHYTIFDQWLKTNHQTGEVLVRDEAVKLF